GLKVVLIESFSYVGGMATGALVSPFMPHHVKGKPLVAGVFEELKNGMRVRKGMIDNGFSADVFRDVAMDLLQDAGVTLMTDAACIEVHRDTARLSGIDVLRKGEILRIAAEQFIDASGDAVLAYLADAPCELSERQQAMTVFFHMKNVDFARALTYVRDEPDNFFPWSSKLYDPSRIVSVAGYLSEVREAHKQDWLSDAVDYVFYCSLPEPGKASFNCVNLLGYDGTRRADLQKACTEGRSQIADIVRLLKNGVPGFENAELDKVADRVGIRETRRVIGDYVMTGEDIRSCRKFEDAVVRGCYGIDIHGQKDEDDVMEDIPEGEYYEMPKRALFVREAENLLAAGRCMSATREAHAALRIMPTCAGMGDAAGRIAAKAVLEHKTLREI
ncbi:MAG: FAD-dependent oxidoreductase, partial [Candidatus Marinimicrobia bacterium]|nr:FAD-dependent oxidoreductase [Candidatus Neomarinimicrobiota bacterium]